MRRRHSTVVGVSAVHLNHKEIEMKEFDQNTDTERLEVRELDTTVKAFDVVFTYSALWKAMHRQTFEGEGLPHAALVAFTRRFGQHLEGIFGDAPESELLPALGETFAEIFLILVGDFAREYTSKPYGKKHESSPPARRRGTRRKSARKENSENDGPQA
jgi:hypothetical protein